MKDITYAEILKHHSDLKKSLKNVNEYTISIISNITIHQIKEILEYSLQIDGINAKVNIGDYDNLVQESSKHKNSNLTIIYWEACNFTDGLQYKIDLFDSKKIDDLLAKVKSEIDLVLENLKDCSLVVFNYFSSIAFNNSNIRKTKLDWLVGELNQYLDKTVSRNVRLVDMDKIISQIGITKSINYRFYSSSKALYTVDFFKSYTYFIRPLLLSANGKSKKILIFDCDNTLWKGILGEDGFDNIEMGPHTKNGIFFHEIQNIAVSLNNNGVLLGLCSKNNSADVEELIDMHPDILIKNDRIAIKKVNWKDKATNLKEIANELNIGLDSFVFIDDSSFEVNLIRDQLPEVTILQVPKKLYQYPKMLRENLGLFYNLSFAKEDLIKNEIYKQQAKRESIKSKYTNIIDYLASLELKINISINNKKIIPRISQMSQKTNQFNLTTQRYTEIDIEKFTNLDSSKVYAWSVSDKFGDNGTTGMSIITVNKENQSAMIDSFLMSCRIIGRNIEFSVMDFIVNDLENSNVKIILANYNETKKNIQVKNFYEDCSFTISNKKEKQSEYKLELKNYKPKNINYIKLENGK